MDLEQFAKDLLTPPRNGDAVHARRTTDHLDEVAGLELSHPFPLSRATPNPTRDRRVVGLAAVGEMGDPVAVTDDGAFFCYDLGEGWVELRPIPGTARWYQQQETELLGE